MLWLLRPWFALLVVSVLGDFFCREPATTVIYTLSLHDALPISNDPLSSPVTNAIPLPRASFTFACSRLIAKVDRKSTRLNSSHQIISYAVFCLKKKNPAGRHESAWCRSNATGSPIPPTRAGRRP